MKFNSREREDKSEQVLVVIAVVLLALFWFGMWQADAQQSISTEEIRSKLCSQDLCLSRWNNVTILACQPRALTPTVPGTDVVFGSFIQGPSSCWCPCNFPKFYR